MEDRCGYEYRRLVVVVVGTFLLLDEEMDSICYSVNLVKNRHYKKTYSNCFLRKRSLKTLFIVGVPDWHYVIAISLSKGSVTLDAQTPCEPEVGHQIGVPTMYIVLHMHENVRCSR